MVKLRNVEHPRSCSSRPGLAGRWQGQDILKVVLRWLTGWLAKQLINILPGLQWHRRITKHAGLSSGTAAHTDGFQDNDYDVMSGSALYLNLSGKIIFLRVDWTVGFEGQNLASRAAFCLVWLGPRDRGSGLSACRAERLVQWTLAKHKPGY